MKVTHRRLHTPWRSAAENQPSYICRSTQTRHVVQILAHLPAFEDSVRKLKVLVGGGHEYGAVVMMVMTVGGKLTCATSLRLAHPNPLNVFTRF